MAHYFSEKQDSRLDLKTIKVKVFDLEIELFSGNGVFSKDRLDTGSKQLIENAIMKDGWSLLDLGSGYGVIGIAMKKRFPDSRVLMVDINERAVYLSKRNIKKLRLEGISAKKSDGFENINDRFDTILLNPPQTAGKDVCIRMITEAKDHLNKKGILQLVARHSKGGKSLSEKMKETYGNVDTVAKGSGFRVYASRMDAQRE